MKRPDQLLDTTDYHLRPSSLSINLDIREAPNLTATIEGPLANKEYIRSQSGHMG